MLSLRAFIKNTLTLLKSLKAQKNTYYYTSASVSSKANASFLVCSLDIKEKGLYLVLGHTEINVDVDNIIMANIDVVSGGTALLDSVGRATARGGGGCHGWAFVEATSATCKVGIYAYGYHTSNHTCRGKLLAIKLI